MTNLMTDANLWHADDFYEALIGVHRDLSDAESAALNARLILLLANHIGRREVLEEALACARADARPETGAGAPRLP